jgi:hypothetical protein
MKIHAHYLSLVRWRLLFIILLISACSTQPTPDSVTPSPAPRMTIVNHNTLAPSTTPGDFPTVTPHIFCEESPESFLIIAERGQVTKGEGNETLNLRSGPGTEYRIIEKIEQLETFFVLEGPQCNGGYTWFQINYNGRTGWIAEGNADLYFAEPYLTG